MKLDPRLVEKSKCRDQTKQGRSGTVHHRVAPVVMNGKIQASAKSQNMREIHPAFTEGSSLP
jgi:hypothetical protein